jgi:hypothetical protein
MRKELSQIIESVEELRQQLHSEWSARRQTCLLAFFFLFLIVLHGVSALLILVANVSTQPVAAP